MKKAIFLLFCIISASLLSSCANYPEGTSSAGSSSTGSGHQYISFILRINDGGTISSGGYYVILLNSEVQAIEVTNSGTYTDAMKLYMDPVNGPTFWWLHRIPSVPGPGYEFVATTRIDEYAQIASDGKSVTYTFNTTDTSVVFNQYISNRFTAQAMTTDTYQNAFLGRVLDCMCPGTDITHNDEYSVFVTKTSGPETPLPPDYPSDSLYDWITKSDLPSDYQYINFDIQSLQVNSY